MSNISNESQRYFSRCKNCSFMGSVPMYIISALMDNKEEVKGNLPLLPCPGCKEEHVFTFSNVIILSENENYQVRYKVKWEDEI